MYSCQLQFNEIQCHACELNLAVGSQTAIAKRLVDFNLVVQWRLKIHVHCNLSRKSSL